MRAVRGGHPAAEAGVEKRELRQRDPGAAGSVREVDLRARGHHGEVRTPGNRLETHVVKPRHRDDLREDQPPGDVAAGLSRKMAFDGRIVRGLDPEPGPLDGSPHVAGPGVVGRGGEQPIAVERVPKGGQIVERRGGRGQDVPPRVVPPRTRQLEPARGDRNDLPETRRVLRRYGLGAVAALHRRQQGDLTRHSPRGQLPRDVVEPGPRPVADVIEEPLVAVVPAELPPELAKGAHLGPCRRQGHHAPDALPSIALRHRNARPLDERGRAGRDRPGARSLPRGDRFLGDRTIRHGRRERRPFRGSLLEARRGRQHDYGRGAHGPQCVLGGEERARHGRQP